MKLTHGLIPGRLDGDFYFPFFKLLASKRVIPFAQEAFTENKLIKRVIKQDIDHFQFSPPLFNMIVFLVLHKGLLNGKLRCVLVRIFIYLGRNCCMLEREIMLLEILEDVPFYKIAMRILIITVIFGVLAVMEYCMT